MLRPRTYQQEAVDRIFEALKTKQNALLVAFMAAGKTMMASKIVEKTIECLPEDGRVLILAHKSMLLQQFEEAFQKFTLISRGKIGICCDKLKRYEMSKKITIASVQTFFSRIEKYRGAKLIIIDEVHRVDISNNSQYKMVIDGLREKEPRSRLLGITATPMRLGHGYIYGDFCKPGNVNLFDKVDHRITYAELLEQEYLMPITGYAADTGSLTEDLKSVTVHGDYVLRDLGDLMSREIHIDTAVAAVRQYAGDTRHVIAFCTTIDHAIKVYSALEHAGESCTLLHSKIPPSDQKKNIEEWESGKKRIISTVNMVTEGYDFPPADCILNLCPTKSPAKYLQGIGRIARIHDGKTKAVYIDCTDNTSEFGTDLDKIQAKIPNPKPDADPPPMKLCPLCESLLYCSARQCACGYVFPENTIPARYLPEMRPVSFSPKKSEWDVIDCMEYIHQSKKNEKLLLKIIYNVEQETEDEEIRTNVATLWLCLPDFYEGYAVEMARKKIAWFGEHEMPSNVEEGLALIKTFPRPKKITCKEKQDEKYLNLEIISVHFDELDIDDMPAEDDWVPF